MNTPHAALRRAARLPIAAQRQVLASQRHWARYASNASQPGPRRRGGRAVGSLAVFGIAAAGTYFYPQLKDYVLSETEEAEPAKVTELQFEETRRQGATKEEHRDLISSQHLQVKNSWEHPGVYAWGSNTGKVIDPKSNDKYIKTPRRIAFFDNQLLRDLKLTQDFGAAVTETGDLIQWGLGFSKANPAPSATLKGKDLVKIDVSSDRIVALSRKGNVYSIPCSRDDLDEGVRLEQPQTSWGLWTSTSKEALSFRDLTPTSLGRSEKVVDISSGLHHSLILTSKGRVFAAASSTADFPTRGQLGIPGLTWATKPAGPYDQAHEIKALKGFEAEKIATGDLHSVVLDKLGRVFTWGDNTFGQLGFSSGRELAYVDAPSTVDVNKLYRNSGLVAKATSIAAGGLNTFFTVDADAPANGQDLSAVPPGQRLPRSVSDVWAAGQGVYGSLGTGKWTHVSQGPTKLKSLSALYEFDETTNKMTPIKLKSLTVGATHSSAVLGNVTQTSVSSRGGENDINWGADVLFWGGNEHYQLGTGKRANSNVPTYIGPLDGGEGDAKKGRTGELHRLCLTPRQTAKLGEGGKGRKVTLEQKVECGRFVTGVYSAV